MPRIESIPTERLADELRAIIEGGVEQDLYAAPVPLRMFAYRIEQLRTIHEARTSRGRDSQAVE